MGSEYHTGGREGGGAGNSPAIAQLGGPQEVEAAVMEGRGWVFLTDSGATLKERQRLLPRQNKRGSGRVPYFLWFRQVGAPGTHP